MLPERIEATALPDLPTHQYNVTITRFNEWSNGRPITDEIVREFFWAQERAGYSARTLRLQKVAIKAAIKKAFPSHDSRVSAAMDSFFRSIKTPTPEMHVQDSDILSKPELRTLINSSRKLIGLFVRALYNTGARISELLSVRLSNSVRDRNVYRCKIVGKGRRERTLIIDRALFEEISTLCGSQEFLFEHQNRPYSRQFLGREIRKHAIQILGRDLHPHSLRHSRITHLLAAGKPLEAVSKFAGHTTAQTTVRFYAHNILSTDDIVESGI